MRGKCALKHISQDKLSVGSREKVHWARAAKPSKGWAMDQIPLATSKLWLFQGVRDGLAEEFV